NESIELIDMTTRERRIPLVLVDRQQILANQLEAQITPQFFVIDREGLLRYQGAFDDTSFRQRTATRGYLMEAVTALLTGQQPEVTETPSFGCTIVRFPD
ncbi:MAG TPA: hypothetical protein VF338_10215, partial [Leptolinea sp.]